MSEYIKKLPFEFDREKLTTALSNLNNKNIGWGRDNQIALTHRLNEKDKWLGGTGSSDYVWGHNAFNNDGMLRERRKKDILHEKDFIEFNEELKDTYFYEIYKTLSTMYTFGRVRIIKIPSMGVLSWHTDREERIHVPIITNSGSRLSIYNKCYFLPADGSAYIINVKLSHTAFNGGFSAKYNLLLNIVDYKPGAVTNLDLNTGQQNITEECMFDSSSYDIYGIKKSTK